MTTFAEKIIAVLSETAGLTDRELTDRIKNRSDPQQQVNQEARFLEQKGLLKRTPRHDGKIGNYLVQSGTPVIHRGEMAIAPTTSLKILHDVWIGIAGYQFEYICDIEPLKNPDGTVTEFMPQNRYKNIDSVNLNKYGRGSFCKFKIPNKYNICGVYALLVGKNINYIGECVNLSQRYNMGYGNISPRNCYIGGQETNCRLNHLIYTAINDGGKVSLWFMETEKYKGVEAEIRSLEKYVWNRV